MRHFVYLDNEMMASYYSQAFGGLETVRTTEVGDSTQSTTTDEVMKTTADIGVEVGRLLVKFKGNGSAETTTPYAVFTESEFGRELVARALHDNAFDAILGHAASNALLCQNDVYNLGKYVDLCIPYHIIDLEYLVKRTGKGFLEFVSENAVDKHIKNIPPNMNLAVSTRERERRKAAENAAKEEIENVKKAIEKVRACFQKDNDAKCRIILQR